jgi:alkylation response protein AidB-like acyl-CoA dehydrogenase
MSIDQRAKPMLDAAAEHAASVDAAGGFPTEAVNALRSSGLLGLTFPESAGGLGGSPSDFLSVTRAIASRCASTAMVYVMHVCAAEVARAGTSDGGSTDVKAMADGSNLSTLAFSERGSRSHFWAPTSQLEGSRLKAQKSFVTGAGHADSYVVSTRSAEAVEPVESSLYLVPASAAGVTTGPAWDGLGLRGNASGPMTFDIDLEDASQLGDPGKGLDLMLGVVLPWFQLGQGAVSLGIADAAMSAAVAHVSGATLEHLGQTLAELPTVRGRLGRAQIEVETVSGFVADVARRMTEGDRQTPILAAKAAANEMAIRVTSETMQACGGAAMSKTLPIERAFRDARAGSVMAPTTDVLYEMTGRALVGMPLM